MYYYTVGLWVFLFFLLMNITLVPFALLRPVLGRIPFVIGIFFANKLPNWLSIPRNPMTPLYSPGYSNSMHFFKRGVSFFLTGVYEDFLLYYIGLIKMLPTQLHLPLFCSQVCTKGFKTRGSLEKHSVTHNYDKRIPCPRCGKLFTQQSAITRHMVTHTGESVFEIMPVLPPEADKNLCGRTEVGPSPPCRTGNFQAI